LIAGTVKASIRIFGLKSGHMLKELKGHESFLIYLSFFNKTENNLLTGSEDG
jgi:hypothetical protein